MRKRSYERFKTKLAFNNSFVIITNQGDLNVLRSNQNPQEKTSIAVPHWFKINYTYYSWQLPRHGQPVACPGQANGKFWPKCWGPSAFLYWGGSLFIYKESEDNVARFLLEFRTLEIILNLSGPVWSGKFYLPILLTVFKFQTLWAI